MYQNQAIYFPLPLIQGLSSSIGVQAQIPIERLREPNHSNTTRWGATKMPHDQHTSMQA